MPKKATPKPVKKAAVKAAPKKVVKVAKPAKVVKAAKPAKAAPVVKAKPVKVSPVAKAGKTGPKKGRGRVTSASGPLSTAVVAVLKRIKRPASCAEITDALIKKGYQFTHPEPKRIVSIRIYKLKGVKQTGPGRFTSAE